MAKQTINIGTIANDGTGSTLRAAGDLINDNFNEIYSSIGDGTTLGSGYITASSSDTLTNKSGNISQWTNDSGYLTSISETNDLTSSVTWANVPDANITQSSVTQHQAALSITESQISDLQTYVTTSSTNTLTNKTFDANGTGNTISNIEVADFASGVLDTDLSTVSSSDNTLASAKAIKTYVDNIAAAGIHYHNPVRVEAITNLNATYNNGTSGVGATLTNNGTLTALIIDGITLSTNDRVLVYNQTNAAHNGVYYVSTVGDGATAWVLTRTTDTDSYGASDPDSLGEGDAFFVSEGNTGAGELYVMNTEGTITFGTTNINFSQISTSPVFTGGDGIDITGTIFSVDYDDSTINANSGVLQVKNGGITSTQLNGAVNLQILDSSGSVLKTLYGTGT